jgi:tRNA dimethylallyltransferase
MSLLPIQIIFGATASGKSAAALALAQQKNGVIINADASQLYADLRILTARPSVAEEALAPHRLYGILPATQASSVALWLEQVKPAIEQAWQQQQLPILCGGTGMYLKALTEGLAEIPPIPATIRTQVQSLSAPALHAQLAACDPAMADRLMVTDTQRLRRAVEVFLASGKPLSYWQAQPKQPLFPQATIQLEVLNPPRAELYARCNARFVQMIEQGAIAEVEALLQRNLPAHLPIMKAVGVPELAAFLRKEISLDTAITLAQQHTRNYAKRQITWLRHQLRR